MDGSSNRVDSISNSSNSNIVFTPSAAGQRSHTIAREGKEEQYGHNQQNLVYSNSSYNSDPLATEAVSLSQHYHQENTAAAAAATLDYNDNEVDDEEGANIASYGIDTNSAVSRLAMAYTNDPRPRQLFDRRGFDAAINFNIAMLLVGFIILNLVSWKIGLALLICVGVTLHTLDCISSPSGANPKRFSIASRRASNQHSPVLLCFGDSITHGKCSANIVSRVPKVLCQMWGIPKFKKDSSGFRDPVWVVNSGQNSITSYTVLEERVEIVFKSVPNPNYIYLMIGTNDAFAISDPNRAKFIISLNRLPQVPSLETYEDNIRKTIQMFRERAPRAKIAIATLPPLTEDLTSNENRIIQDMNAILERIVSDNAQHCSIIPVFPRLTDFIERKTSGWTPSLHMALPLMTIQNLLYQNLYPMFNWNRLSWLGNNTVLTDGIHLNERAAEAVAELIAEWLVQQGVSRPSDSSLT